MLVYGDAREEACPRAALRAVGAELAALGAAQGAGLGVARHGAFVAAFIQLAGLAQGYADWEAAALGYDEKSDGQERFYDVLRQLALVIDRSWRRGFDGQCPIDLAPLDALAWPATVTIRRCEGYAYYGVYPELYLTAARDLPRDCVVIGLRSIGTGLAALVAAACGTTTIVTVRPAGHPFARSVAAGAELERWVAANAHRDFVIVDEGPGLSGSSFGGTADWLERVGVAGERIIFVPSHEGGPGSEATAAHRRRWANADKRVGSFEQLFIGSGARVPLGDWFRDVTGDPVAAPSDLSAGGWAAGRPDVPTSPGREAHKYLLTGTEGRFIAKFVGLDAVARAKWRRATALGEAGFCPAPLAMRYGFVIERWVEGASAEEVSTAHLIAYLRFRRERFPARQPGASLSQLLDMARHNCLEAGIDFPERWSAARVRALQAVVAPVQVDARLHRWEWLRAEGQWLKTDAVDHAEAHDLVGCQDILWDVAGAAVELAGGEQGELAEAFTSGVPARRELLALMTTCYLAFQMGWWSLSGTPAGAARSRFYRDQLVADLSTQG